MGTQMAQRRIWAVANWSGDILPWTVAYTRARAIEKVMEMFNKNQTWKRLYRQGWRVIRVRVEPI